MTTETTASEVKTAAVFTIPQADDIDKVFDIAVHVNDGVTTADGLADAMGMVVRQGEYYAAAAEMLGLVVRDDKNEYSLTSMGKAYIATTEPVARRDLRRRIVMRSPIIRHLANGLGIKRPVFGFHAHLFEDTKATADQIEEFGYATDTALRRAFTIRSWMRDL